MPRMKPGDLTVRGDAMPVEMEFIDDDPDIKALAEPKRWGLSIPAHETRPGDPASWMLFDGVETIPTVYDPNCYICNDPEYAKMGLPLCYTCPTCGEHVAADSGECEHCGWRGEVMNDLSSG